MSQFKSEQEAAESGVYIRKIQSFCKKRRTLNYRSGEIYRTKLAHYGLRAY